MTPDQVLDLVGKVTLQGAALFAVYILYRDGRQERKESRERSEKALDTLTVQIGGLADQIRVLVGLLSHSPVVVGQAAAERGSADNEKS